MHLYHILINWSQKFWVVHVHYRFIYEQCDVLANKVQNCWQLYGMYVFLFLSTLNWDSLLIRYIKLEEKKERKYQYIMHHSFMRKLALYETEPVTQIPAINRNPQKKPHEAWFGFATRP